MAFKLLLFKRLMGLEAWHWIVVPLRPQSEAKCNTLRTSVHSPLKSKSFSIVFIDLDDWEKVVEQLELQHNLGQGRGRCIYDRPTSGDDIAKD